MEQQDATTTRLEDQINWYDGKSRVAQRWFKGLKVLIVDDITDTGDTVGVAFQHIQEFDPAEVRVAVLQHKRQSMLKPDFYAKKLTKWRWIIYPWAVVEDIGGFLLAMPELPATIEAAGKILKAD